MRNLLPAIVLLAGWCALAAAQPPVYESKDKAGPVFSDRPSQGAKPLDLPPPNVIQTPASPKQKAAPSAPAPAYTSLAVTAPANGDTIHSNTGAFDVRVKTVPALGASAGDRIRLKLDGNALPSGYKSGKIRLTDADWQSAGSSTSAEHTLQAAIVDATGNVKIESAPVSFFVRRAAVGGKR